MEEIQVVNWKGAASSSWLLPSGKYRKTETCSPHPINGDNDDVNNDNNNKEKEVIVLTSAIHTLKLEWYQD